MNRFGVILVGLFFICGNVNATDYWTVKIKGGVISKSNSFTAIHLGGYQPHETGKQWTQCNNGWIRFDKTHSGTVVSEKSIDRMLAVALTAFKTNGFVRVGIDRDASNNCYTNQMWDRGG